MRLQWIKVEENRNNVPTYLGDVWPAADGDHYSNTPALFAKIAFIAVIQQNIWKKTELPFRAHNQV